MIGKFIYTWIDAEEKIADLEDKLKIARSALIKQVGDARECPHSRLALDAYQNQTTCIPLRSLLYK